MNKIKLDQEEQEVLASFEGREFVSDLTENRKSFLADIAAKTSKKDKRINSSFGIQIKPKSNTKHMI